MNSQGMIVNPGPIESDLLFLKENHRAYHLFYNELSATETLITRRGDQMMHQIIKINPISEGVLYHIREAGFGGVLDCGYKQLDSSLITALVERWRPETHTFHLPVGEATVTLQDVEVIWGLRTEGEAVCVEEWKWTPEIAVNTCESLLGFTPALSAFKGHNIKISTLCEQMTIPFPNDAAYEECLKRARIYLLVLLGGALFPDFNNHLVPLNMITCLIDLKRCGELSWGSAVIACLHRNLCKATVPTAKQIAGPLVLLQLWAWARIQAFAPIVREFNDFTKPYGARWDAELVFKDADASRYSVVNYRSILTALHKNEFNWTPYKDILPSLPLMCVAGQVNWTCDTYVVYWEIVEEHLPSRVMRQFSLKQTIPTVVLTSQSQHKKLHKDSRRGNSGKNWMAAHASYIAHWSNRVQYRIEGEWTSVPFTDDNYITFTDENPLQPERLHYISQQYLHMTHAEDHMSERWPLHASQDYAVPDMSERHASQVQRLPTRGVRIGETSASHPDMSGVGNPGPSTYNFVTGPSTLHDTYPAGPSHGQPSTSNYATPSSQINPFSSYVSPFENCYRPEFETRSWLSLTPIPMTSFSADSTHEEQDNEIGQEEDEIPDNLRRGGRIRRERTCGTHGILQGPIGGRGRGRGRHRHE